MILPPKALTVVISSGKGHCLEFKQIYKQVKELH